ncbi:hypothetical protein AAG906_035217 [Vitis piasezkii]
MVRDLDMSVDDTCQLPLTVMIAQPSSEQSSLQKKVRVHTRRILQEARSREEVCLTSAKLDEPDSNWLNINNSYNNAQVHRQGVFINPTLVDPFGLTLIEWACGYYQGIVDVLLKLLVDKNLWFECRKNGLKNTPRFSCIDEPMSDSLRDLEDFSLKFYVDGDFKLNGKPVGHANHYHSGRRQGLFVITTDFYDSNGDCTERLPIIIKNVMKSTSSEIDALVCNSGSEIYYPWRDLIADFEYEAHMEYQWPGENVRLVVTSLAREDEGAEDDIVEYAGVCSTKCHSYGDADERLLLQPCLYTCYIKVECGTLICIKGPSTKDTYYEDLLVGLHKTIILGGLVEYGSEKLLHSLNIIFVKEGYEVLDTSTLSSTIVIK